MEQTRVVLKNIGTPDSEKLKGYLRNGGYQALERGLKDLSPPEVLESVKRSGLRGRGGAGFPTGMKWQFCAADNKTPKYLICNADEGEPGTFKDRLILEQDPHAVLEGMALAGYAIGAEQGIIYLRGEYLEAGAKLEAAIAESRQNGYLGKNIKNSGFDFDVRLFMGAGAYICGEETALLDSLEGKIGQSRVKPPFPVNEGLWRRPTVVNNVETLVNIPQIVLNGDAWFNRIGSPECPGTKIYSVSGHVNKPGNYEFPMGITLRELIYEHAGGVWKGRNLKAVLPGGASSPCLTADQLDVKLDFHHLSLAGSMLGSGAVVVMDDHTCLVGAALSLVRFFNHESCGRCSPCREGGFWVIKLLERIQAGTAELSELDLLLDLGKNMQESSFCPLGMACANGVLSFINKFRSEFEAHITLKRCPMN